MKHFNEISGYSLVTAILPRQSAHRVLEAVLEFGGAHALTLNARGSLIKDRWYQSFLPTLSPEQEILSFLVPNQDTEPLMEQIVMVGKLRMYGAGSIFTTECTSLRCAEDYPLWTPGKYRFESTSFDIRFKKDLIALFQIADKGEAESICRVAVKAGAQGATISYTRGYGLRDRLGLLRITKKREKELITVVVDQCDVDAVYQAMADAGRVDLPGRGFIYQVPISQGLTNLSSVFHPKKHSASIQQIIRAIDDMQGDTHWRANHLLVHDPKAADFAQSTRGTITDRVVHRVVCARKDTGTLLDQALNFGVPGASVDYWRFAEANAEHTKGGLRINRELGNITTIVKRETIEPLQAVLRKTIQQREMKGACFITYPAPSAKTFVRSTNRPAVKEPTS
ncbi:MAG: hypothetical protein AAGD22_14310 [Verrucomicrobiota bacterium]